MFYFYTTEFLQAVMIKIIRPTETVVSAKLDIYSKILIKYRKIVNLS